MRFCMKQAPLNAVGAITDAGAMTQWVALVIFSPNDIERSSLPHRDGLLMRRKERWRFGCGGPGDTTSKSQTQG
jgi:hypothetical protein